MERRQSAIFAADMVDNSRLMEVDEIGTIKRQKIHRTGLINPAFDKYNGRIVKEIGVGVLVEVRKTMFFRPYRIRLCAGVRMYQLPWLVWVL